MRDSYRPFLERSGLFDSVRNLSIGGTPNVIIPYILAQHKVRSDEIVILETAVNDAWCIQAERLSLERIASIENEAVEYLNSLGVTPILLIMPAMIDATYIDQVRDIYYNIESKGKAQVLDGYPVLWALQKETGHPIRELFLDEGHVITHVAGAIAIRLLNLIRGQASFRERQSKGSINENTLPYIARNLHDSASASIFRNNSQYEHRYGILEPEDVVDVDFDEEVQLLGISFNLSGSSAIVEIATDSGDKVAYDFRCVQERSSYYRAFTHALAPIPNDVIGRKITIRVLKESDVRKQSIVPLGHAKFGSVNLERLEVEALILRRGRGPVTTVIHNDTLPGPADLTQEERMIAQFIDVGRSASSLLATGRLFNNAFHSKRDYSRDEKADLLRDIGRLALQSGNNQIAKRCLSLALQERPSGAYIRRLLHQAQSREESATNSA